MPIPIAMDIPNIEMPEIEINGIADEKAWEQALLAGDFTTYRPKPDQEPRAQTVVKILSSKEALYLHFSASHEPEKNVYAGFGRRDSRKGDDYVGVLIDPLGSGERGALFISNALGVQLDGTLVRGRDSDLVPWGGSWSSWDTQWVSSGRITDDGYEVEIAIPWASIRHPAVIDTLGLTVFRRIARGSEMSAWPRLDPNIEGTLVQAASLGGPGAMPKSLGLSVLPEVTATRTNEGVQKDRVGIAGVAPGLTLEAAPSPALQLLATLNPDFSQVESDEAKIDINQRYSLQYEEKRPFFLEGQEWFTHPIKDLIYTRSMVAPLYGARATSETGQFTSAVLHVHDQNPSGSVAEEGGWSNDEVEGKSSDSTVARLQWASENDGMVGAILSHKSIRGADLQHSLFGVDGRIKLSRRITLQAAALGSSTDGIDQENGVAPAGVLRTLFRTRHLQGRVETRYRSKDFRSENGFQPISDAITVINRTEIVTYPKWQNIPRLLFSPTDGEFSIRENGELREYDFRPSIGSWFGNGTYFMVEGGPGGEEYEDIWLDYSDVALMGGGSWTSWLRTRMRLEAGQAPYYDGDEPSIGDKYAARANIVLQPFRRFSFSPSLSWERFMQDRKEVYQGVVARLKLEAFATPTIWNRWILDHSTFSENRTVETLFAWERMPGQAIYLGGRYSIGGINEDGAPDPNLSPSWALFTKLSWVFSG